MNFSIIIPAYNIESYIKRTLVSLENQTLDRNDFEVIIINDGSNDSTLTVIENYILYSSLNVKVINQDNSGVSSARNLGIIESTGEYLYFLDGDDYIGDCFLELIRNEISVSSADLVITSYIKVYGDNEIKFFNKHDGVSLEELKGKCFSGGFHINMCNVIFKRATVKELDLTFDVNTSYGEDLEFYHKFIFHCASIAVVTEALFYYVYRSGSAVNSKVGLKREGALLAIIRVEESIRHIYSLNLLRSTYASKFIPSHILKVIYNLVLEDDCTKAIHLLNKKAYRKYIFNAQLNGLQSLKIQLIKFSPGFYVLLLALIQKIRRFLS